MMKKLKASKTLSVKIKWNWEIDQDKQMIRNLISSIPKQLQAVTDVDADYLNVKAEAKAWKFCIH